MEREVKERNGMIWIGITWNGKGNIIEGKENEGKEIQVKERKVKERHNMLWNVMPWPEKGNKDEGKE
jgi:hypothetical protein